MKRQTKAKVQCDCGRIRDVYMMHLRSGATKSCGKGPCRPKTECTRPPRSLAPTGSRVMTMDQIQKAWASYYSVDTRSQRSFAQLARRYRVNLSTLYDIFRTVRDVGGIDDYTALVEKGPRDGHS